MAISYTRTDLILAAIGACVCGAIIGTWAEARKATVSVAPVCDAAIVTTSSTAHENVTVMLRRPDWCKNAKEVLALYSQVDRIGDFQLSFQCDGVVGQNLRNIDPCDCGGMR